MAHAQYSCVRTRTEQTTRCRRDKKAAAKNSTAANARYDFLKYRFLPLAGIANEIKDRKQVEREYFTSLAHMAALYGFAPIDVSDKVYPHNILMSYQHATEILKQREPKLHLIIIQDEQRLACLATVRVFDTGTTLYYIPVKPLFDLLRQKRKKEAGLVLSVFAYLYQVACIPHYKSDNGFLEGNYEMIKEWLTQDPDDWEAEEYDSCLSEVRAADYGGVKLLEQIRHKYHLQQFEQRLNEFAPANQIQQQLLECSTQLMQLYKGNPKRTFYDNIMGGLLDPSDEERINPEQYVSFIWSNDGWLAEQLTEQVNYALQELRSMDEPLTLQYFDKPQQAAYHDLEFETKLFGLMDDLTYILNRIV